MSDSMYKPANLWHLFVRQKIWARHSKPTANDIRSQPLTSCVSDCEVMGSESKVWVAVNPSTLI